LSRPAACACAIAAGLTPSRLGEQGSAPCGESSRLVQEPGESGCSAGHAPSPLDDTAVPFWHTSVVESTASACTFILDGTVIGTATRRIPNTPMHWVLQSETVPDHVTNSSDTADIHIAWVTLYRPG
jgi:hypothetical protein